MLEGRGGNIGVLVGDEGILIVDDQFLPLAEKIKAALGSVSDAPLKYVLNTHHHGDHTGSNEFFGDYATIMAHENVRERLVAADKPKSALPVITFDHGASVHFSGEHISLLHHGPGHTDGDSIIRFEHANVVHMGDLFFNGRFPYVDLNSGGSIDGYIAAVSVAIERVDEATKIIPGHGPLANKADLVRYRNMIRDTVAVIRGAKEDGQNIGDILRSGVMGPWESWGQGWITTERWVQTVFNEGE
jgi:glyoxylase-like metal-dependent hydrolase (beta-lactamase superfamily II)